MAPADVAIDLDELAPDLGSTCREYVRSHSEDLDALIVRGEGGVQLGQRRAAILDGLLSALFCAADAAARAATKRTGRVALVAAGSYGRRELSLCSDIDVAFLCDDPEDEGISALTHAFLYPLWDMGLKVGHSVRGLEETLALAHSDIKTATTLLDLRRIGGDEAVVAELLARGREDVLDKGLTGFLEALEKDTRDRHERFGGSLYLLEPEVKLGRGGLRDIDVGIWAARARWPVARPEELVSVGALEDKELADLRGAQDALFRVRNLLHFRARRNQDRLTFEDQEEIAVRLGFEDGKTLGVEQFMQGYYRHARAVAGLSERLLKRSRPHRPVKLAPLRDLPEGLVSTESELSFRRPWVLDTNPEVALEAFVEVIRHGRPLTDASRDDVAAWAADSSWCQALRRGPTSASLFCKLLCHAGEVAMRRNSILGELHELGLFLALLPEFEEVTGRVQHDVYHVYTVDVHSIAAVDRLRALMRGDYAFEYPLASQLAAETPRPLPLFLGLLLHDIGKAHGVAHSRKGALMARPIAERLGLAPLDVDHVVWLVQEHLSLYHWATRRDTTDPGTIEELARLVGSTDRLRDLYLLTLCDVSTTNPQAMTEWKSRMLEDLYVALSRVLEGRAPNITQRAEELRRNACVGFVGDLGQELLEDFVAKMPERYILAHPVDVIRTHARAARDRNGKLVHVASFPGPAKDVTELMVTTDDRPGLLADVAAALSANRVEIAAAEIYSRPRSGLADEAVDLLHVRSSTHREAGMLDEEQVESLSRDIEAVLRGQVRAPDLLAKRPRLPSWARRRGPDVRTKVVIDNSVSPRYTVVDVYARDHVGLLYAITHVLRRAGLSIALSKINTEGLKAADVFYVEVPGRGKVDAGRCEPLRQELVDAIEASRESQA